MFTAETKIRVRYGETDQMGYVYHGNYALYYEVGRVEALRLLGMSHNELEQQGVMMPVYKMECMYIAPARYDDELTIKTTVTHMPGFRMHFFYEVYNEGGVLLNKGETTLVFIDRKTNRITHCPESLTNRIKPYF